MLLHVSSIHGESSQDLACAVYLGNAEMICFYLVCSGMSYCNHDLMI